MLAVGAIMHRQPETRWNDDEKKALAKAYPNITSDNLRRVGAYYDAHWPPDRDKNNLRHDVMRLVRHFGGELDRANAWLARLPRGKRDRLLADPGAPPTAPAPSQAQPEPLRLPTEQEMDAGWEEAYRTKVRSGFVRGVPASMADEPKLVIPPRPRQD